jgi:hypothetical protein
MWQCELCHNVFHFQCIKTWADPDPIYTPYAMRRYASWTCPYCLAVYSGFPRATCWCGKQSSGAIDNHHDRPNACPDLCEKVTKCKHDRVTDPCMKPCHPGPCNTPCQDSCADVVPDIPSIKPSSWNRLRKRLQRRTTGTLTGLLLHTFGVCGMYLIIAMFTKIHIRWWTQPWRYHHFTEVSGKYEVLSLILVGIFVVLPILIIALISWLITVGEFFNTLLNLDDTSTRGKPKTWIRRVGSFFLCFVAGASIIIPFVA